MQPNATRFAWTKPRLDAALHVAKDERTDQQIAEACGIHKVTLERWKLRPEFQARVVEHRKAWASEIKARGIAERQNRIDALNVRWKAMQQVIEERSADQTMVDVPGGRTGLLVHRLKGVGSGEKFQVVDEYEVDTGLLKELRDHERQAAQELGQWVERSQNLLNLIDLSKLSDEQLDRIAAGEDPVKVILGT
jgi:hypothetical protein